MAPSGSCICSNRCRCRSVRASGPRSPAQAPALWSAECSSAFGRTGRLPQPKAPSGSPLRGRLPITPPPTTRYCAPASWSAVKATRGTAFELTPRLKAYGPAHCLGHPTQLELPCPSDRRHNQGTAQTPLGSSTRPPKRLASQAKNTAAQVVPKVKPPPRSTIRGPFAHGR